jgi:hypothetical protein
MSRLRRLPPGVTKIKGARGSVQYRGRVRRCGKSMSATFGDPHEAGAWVQDIIARLRRGESPSTLSPSPLIVGKTFTFEEAAKHYFLCAAAGKVISKRGGPFAASSLQVMESATRRCVVPHLGPFPIDSISRRDVRQLFDHLASSVPPQTLVAAKTALDGIFAVAERDGLADGPSPADGVNVRRPPARRVGRALTRDEQIRLVEAARAQDDERQRSLMYPLVELLLGTGLRIGEACALAYDPDSGLDLDAGLVHVTRTVGVSWTTE